MEINILLTIGLGLGVPIITFFITYKKTIGVRRERERTAYREIVSLIAKLVAHEQINPNLDVINGLIRSKAREYNVNIEISSLPIIFEDIMTKFVENEFISQDVKKNLIDKVLSLQEDVLEDKEAKEAAIRVQEPSIADEYRILLSTLSAIVAAITLVTITKMMPKIAEAKILIEPFAILATLTVVFTTLFFYMRIIEERKEKETESTRYGGPFFEKMVFSALEKRLPKENIERGAALSGSQRVDFLLQIHGERIPIKIKYRTVQPNSIKQMRDYMKKLGAKRAALITNSSTTTRIRKFAEENNISLIDNVHSEEDIINRLNELDIIEVN